MPGPMLRKSTTRWPGRLVPLLNRASHAQSLGSTGIISANETPPFEAPRARPYTVAMSEPSGAGSTGNVIAALASLLYPGLGQLLQGRFGMAVVQFVMATVLWFVLLGWIIHIWSILDAAKWDPAEDD